jgi:membrane dipeptidase
MKPAQMIHKEAVIIDATCPLASMDEFHHNYAQGGVTVIAATVGYGMANIGTFDFTMKNLGKWFEKFRDDPKKLVHITCVEDIYRAKKRKPSGDSLSFPGHHPF